MGVIEGGITGHVTGSVAGVTFSKARGRRGIVNTARQKVVPSNPQTLAQTTQRTKFKDVLDIVRRIGPSIYQNDFNRSVSQLPGFQSLMALLMAAMDDAGTLTAMPDIPLGDLPVSPNMTPKAVNNPLNVGATWSTYHPSGANEEDAWRVIAIEANRPAGRPRDVSVNMGEEFVRENGSWEALVSHPTTDYLIIGYFVGMASNIGKLSKAQSWVVTTPALP